MRRLLFSLFFSLFSVLSFTEGWGETHTLLREKYHQAHPGDYIVTAQDNTYSLLFIREITADHLLLEEIAVPESQINLKSITWDKWLQAKAPGHTSWTLYEIDSQTGNLIEAFSYSKKGWLYLDQTQQFLSHLLTLPLTQLPTAERKKIGPRPSSQEEDHRALWNPPVTIQGKKLHKPQCEAWAGIWPEDGTQMGKCQIELYFLSSDPSFPFPYWIEIKSPHYAFKMRTIDSGKGMTSPYGGPIPHRPPQFKSPLQKKEKGYSLTLQSPLYYHSFHLYAIDVTDPLKKTIPISHRAHRIPQQETVSLNISEKELTSKLTPGHRYQWFLIPQEDGKIYVESDEILIWKP